MSTTKKLVTSKFHVESAGHFVQSVDTGDAAYFVFAAKHTPYLPDDATLTQPNNSVQSSTLDIFDNLIFGKRVTSSDVEMMVKRTEWTSGTTYSMYTHVDGDLFDKDFYVWTLSGTNYNLYKCLSNGTSPLYPNGRPSTVEPSGMDWDPIESPLDGYLWKYMGTTPSSVFDKFKTTTYAPFLPNTAIVANSKPGTIEYIRIDDAGLGYNNYFTGSFRSDDIRLGGVDTIYGLLDTASSINDYYQGCVIKVTSGAAAGEYREIINYAFEAGKKKIFLESRFDNNPGPNDTYEIYPLLYVFGDGSETANCIARAIIDSGAGNSVSSVEILNTGQHIRSAQAALILKDVVGVTANAVLTPIISPPGGHGSRPYHELAASRVCVSVKFDKSESGYIPATNDFRTVGIIKDPLFANLAITIDEANTQGNFYVGETVYQYRKIVLTGSANTSANIATVTGTNTRWDTSLVANDYILITDGTTNFFTQVDSVANSTQIVTKVNVPFTGVSLEVSLLSTFGIGEITSVDVGSIVVSNCDTRMISSSQAILGGTSYTTSWATASNLNGSIPNGLFQTFNGMKRFIGTISGTFVADELVVQPSALVVANALNSSNTYANALLSYQPQAYLHSYTDTSTDDVLMLTNVKHVFNTNQVITGNTSTAQFTLSYKYPGDVVPDSGDVFYIENVDPITRGSNRSETIKIILEF